MVIKVEVDDKIYNATATYLKEKGGDEEELSKAMAQGAANALDKAYAKHVPKAVRDYIALEKSLSKKKKSVSQDTHLKEETENEQREFDRQDMQ